MSENTGRLLHEKIFEKGRLLYVMDPKVGLDGESLRDEPFDHFIIAYFVSGPYARRVGHAFFDIYAKSSYVEGIGVDEKFRRKGIASKILSLVEEECKKRKIENVEICPHTTEGKNLLNANGYSKVGGLFSKKTTS